ncbi:MAG TPA: SPOR domain-containing protein [Candidatus Tenderia electrophaga]|uniref:SPOR domain-containing protein n=1 Tax=Candidatus Tenderia electrophaga TaxID=1748243 RepID=A0A832J2Q1_9GAMM|nr:SPOR domain-containing protein [Candidatus Tenderia electrophaga]
MFSNRAVLINIIVATVMLFGAAAVQAGNKVPYLQVGVFSDKAAAEKVLQQLKNNGFNAEQRTVDVIGRPAEVVLVGPFERTSQALYEQRRLRDIGWPAAVKRFLFVPKPEPKPVSKPESKPRPKPSSFRVSTSGSVTAELRGFFDEPLYAGQRGSTASLAVQPELYISWNDRKSSLTFVPFVRVGDKDDARNHADVRELMWINAMGDWELRLGVGKVFWGVTESVHLVDIINQVDLVESPDREEKLGQPMLNLSRFTDWGTWELFVLPLFREQTFAGVNGRLRGPLVVNTDLDALYESDDRDKHVDLAVRWSHYIGDWDIGLSHFSGTSRAPGFVPVLNAFGQPEYLLPLYNLIEQTGLTLQALLGDWAWKLEATSTKEKNQRYTQSVVGFEYTHVGVFESSMDLGLLLEYIYDSRGELAPGPFEDDVMLGTRWVFNDMQSSEILVGVIADLDGGANSTIIEASRRLGQSWKLALEYRGSSSLEATDPIYMLRNDDYFQLELGYFF